MKKVLSIFMIGFMLFAAGCPDKQETPKSDENKMQVIKINMKSAKELMDNYMRYVIKRDNGAMRSFYSPKMQQKIMDTPSTSNPHPVGFSVEEGENKDKNAQFKAHIFSGYTGSPYFSDDEFTYTVSIESGKMLIDKIEKGKTIELYEKNNQIYKREGDKIKGEPVVTLKDLPYYVVAKKSSSLEQKFPVPRKRFGPCAISPDGKSMVITSYENDSFIGLISEGESKETMAQPGGKSGGGSGGGSQGGGGGESSQGEETGQKQNKPSGTLKTIDFYFNSKVNIISFSPDGKLFVIDYTPSNGLNKIAVYKAKEGEEEKLKSDKSFRMDRFSISNPYFSGENKLVFTVTPIKGATVEEARFKGDWELDLEKGKLTQIQ